MGDFDWYDIKFLESTSNLKQVIKSSVDREPSAAIVAEISVCLKQGRMFFEAASSSPIEIRPLQTFYGVVGFANALALARSLQKLETFKRSHGLTDASTSNSRIEELCVKIENDGAFQRFNAAVAPLGRIWFFTDLTPTWISKPFHQAKDLARHQFSLKDVFSRIPSLENLFFKTFSERPNVIAVDILQASNDENSYSFRVLEPETFDSREALIRVVENLRREYPFLENWCLEDARVAFGKTNLDFANIDKSAVSEFSDENYISHENRFSLKAGREKRADLASIIPPLSGGIDQKSPYVIQPIKSVCLDEFSLQYIGCFLLSSLVRYKPQIWQYALSRSMSENIVSDDKCLAIIDKFLDTVLKEFPSMIAHSIDYR